MRGQSPAAHYGNLDIDIGNSSISNRSSQATSRLNVKQWRTLRLWRQQLLAATLASSHVSRAFGRRIFYSVRPPSSPSGVARSYPADLGQLTERYSMNRSGRTVLRRHVCRLCVRFRISKFELLQAFELKNAELPSHDCAYVRIQRCLPLSSTSNSVSRRGGQGCCREGLSIQASQRPVDRNNNGQADGHIRHQGMCRPPCGEFVVSSRCC